MLWFVAIIINIILTWLPLFLYLNFFLVVDAKQIEAIAGIGAFFYIIQCSNQIVNIVAQLTKWMHVVQRNLLEYISNESDNEELFQYFNQVFNDQKTRDYNKLKTNKHSILQLKTCIIKLLRFLLKATVMIWQ